MLLIIQKTKTIYTSKTIKVAFKWRSKKAGIICQGS